MGRVKLGVEAGTDGDGEEGNGAPTVHGALTQTIGEG